MDTLWWYVMRSAGLTAWVLLTLTTVWGSLISGRFTSGSARRWLLDLHPFLGGLGLGALGLHLVAVVMDRQSGAGWIDLVVPLQAAWNPVGLAWGVVAVWLLAAVEVTSVLRHRLSRVAWRRIHLTAYGAAWLMAIHAATTGTDLRNPVVRWGALAIVAVTWSVAIQRSLRSRRDLSAARTGAAPAESPARVA